MMARLLNLLVLLLVGLWAGTAATPAQAKYASMVVDANSGEVLHAVNADVQNYPASLTKMMTLYLLFDELDRGRVHLTDEMPVSAHASGQAPSKLGLRPGQTLKVEDAVLGLCTKSANDAAVTVAEFLGGSEPAFADMMTRKAHELGMRLTQFRNASGLPNLGQHSTARDMVTLARALLRNHAAQYHYFSTRQFVYNGQVMQSHNHMMSHYPGADGIKTGYIAASGFNLVASAKRDGRRLIGVVFGGESAAARDRHMMALLDAGFARAPGSTGVELASLPEQSEDKEPEDPVKAAKSAKAGDDGEDETPAVMKAMAHAQPAAKPAATQIRKAAARKPEPEDAGDSEDEEEDSWGIQVGAYSSAAKARASAGEARHKLGRLLADADVSIAHTKGKPVFRARVVGLSEQAAHTACRRLAHLRTPCAVINTETDVASR